MKNISILKPRLIAFYLTQFHPTPQNDAWWGKGFTEWTNVTKSAPLFEGHYQPHLPTDFGFYDLRVMETRRDQVKVAKQFGIDGFCYHYYWFSGERILNQPLDDMLRDRENDMPFCLCWANENWTRRWDAAENEVLIAQKYLPDDDINFIKSLIPFFTDDRYIKVDGNPILIVYRPQHLPNARKTLDVWRDYCRKVGIGELHLCAALTHGNEDYAQYGFDSGVEFPPHNIREANVNSQLSFFKPFIGNVMQYASVADSYLKRDYCKQRVFKTVFPSWDNTARTGSRALVMLNGTPDNYECWLGSTIDLVKNSECDSLIFINAWNEWAEGCHLEPDRKYGRSYLVATARVKSGVRRFEFGEFPDLGLPVTDANARNRRFLSDLTELVCFHGSIMLSSSKSVIKRNRGLYSIFFPFVQFIRRIKSRIFT